MTEPAAGIRSEVIRLVDAQLSIFTQRSTLNDLDLLEHHVLAQRIKELYGQLDGLYADTAKTLTVTRRTLNKH
jgi:hypothetical protein